jgi:hypothetical protein
MNGTASAYGSFVELSGTLSPVSQDSRTSGLFDVNNLYEQNMQRPSAPAQQRSFGRVRLNNILVPAHALYPCCHTDHRMVTGLHLGFYDGWAYSYSARRGHHPGSGKFVSGQKNLVQTTTTTTINQ